MELLVPVDPRGLVAREKVDITNQRRSLLFGAFCNAGGVLMAATIALAATMEARTEVPSPQTLEYRVKGAFLYNFAKFVDWPTNAFASAEAPFVIAVLGDESVMQTLQQPVKGKSIGNRATQVRWIADGARIEPCQILFVAQSKTQQFTRILAALGSAPVLLVGESPGFIAGGGAISFTNDAGSVRFEINAAAAERAGLKISSKLLRVATVVTPAPRDEGK